MKLRHKKPINSYKTDKDDESSEILEDDYRRQFASIRKQTTVGQQQINKMARILVHFLNSINEDYCSKRTCSEDSTEPKNANIKKFLAMPKKSLKELQMDLKYYQKKQEKINKEQINLIDSQVQKPIKQNKPNVTQQKPIEKINNNIQFVPPVFNTIPIKTNPVNNMKPAQLFTPSPNSKPQKMKPEKIQPKTTPPITQSFQQTRPNFSNMPNMSGFQGQGQGQGQTLTPQMLFALLQQKQSTQNMGVSQGSTIPNNFGTRLPNTGAPSTLPSNLGLGNNIQGMNIPLLQQQLLQNLQDSSGKPNMNYMNYIQNFMLLDYYLKLAPYQMQMQQTQSQQQRVGGQTFQPSYLNIANYMNNLKNANNMPSTNQGFSLNTPQKTTITTPQPTQPANKRQQTLNKRACYHITIAYSTYLAKLNEQGKNLKDYKIEDLDPTALAKKFKQSKKQDNILINITNKK